MLCSEKNVVAKAFFFHFPLATALYTAHPSQGLGLVSCPAIVDFLIRCMINAKPALLDHAAQVRLCRHAASGLADTHYFNLSFNYMIHSRLMV